MIELLIWSGFTAGFILFISLPHLHTAGRISRTVSPTVSVIIRSAGRIDAAMDLVSDLRAQSYRPSEILCLTDTPCGDATVLEEHGVRVLTMPAAAGIDDHHTRARETLTREARGELLLFIDEQVRLDPESVESLVRRYIGLGVPITVRPDRLLRHFGESFSLFSDMVDIACTGLGVPFGKRLGGPYEPVLLIPHAGYATRGLHVSVREMDGTPSTEKGRRDDGVISCRLYLGGHLISSRKSDGRIKKPSAGGIGDFLSAGSGIHPVLLVLLILWLVSLSGAAVLPFMEISPGDYISFGISVATYLLLAMQVLVFSRAMGRFHPVAALLYPVPLSGFLIAFFVSSCTAIVRNAVGRKRSGSRT